jgi:hypothetical protein
MVRRIATILPSFVLTQTSVFHYFAYNLSVRSEICLPELPSGLPGHGLEVRLAPVARATEPRTIEWREAPAREARFSFPGVGSFLVRAGSEIIITPDAGADHDIFHLYVEGLMLASALHQRDFLVLHASVIDLNGRAIALMGPIGAGKSTFASTFLARGHRIVADDNAALASGDDTPRVLPAFPSLKVYPDVARSLGHSDLVLRPMHRSQAKHAQPVNGAFSLSPLPLEAIYVLDREADTAVSELSTLDSLTELIRHSVPTRWGVSGNARHLMLCASLVRKVTIFRVRTFSALSEITAIADRIERHADRHCRLA